MKAKTYRVEVVEIATSKVVSVVGRNVPEDRVERRIAAVLHQTNIDKYYVQNVLED